MCSSPDVPAPPPPAQDAKEPDTVQARRKQRQPNVAGGTVLTGASGVSQGSLNTGGNTLLGG